MNTVDRFLNNTVRAFVPRKEFTKDEAIANLKNEIIILESQLVKDLPDTVRNEKQALLRIKMENLETILNDK